MLKQRVLTALILATGLILAVIYLPLPILAGVIGLVVILGGWEWSRLAGWQGVPSRLVYIALLAVSMLTLYRYCSLDKAPRPEQVQPFMGLACLWWSIALLWVKSYPGSAVIWRTMLMRSLMGLLTLALAWLAAVYLLSLPRGSLLMIGLVIVVAAADIGAYFSGRRWGRHQLAPAVSPGKTWEGFWGGVLCTAFLALLVSYALPTDSHPGVLALFVIILATGLASVVGDLMVSMVKRESHVKDSGSLLPGHGGILDRLDSLSAAAPVFTLGLLLSGW